MKINLPITNNEINIRGFILVTRTDLQGSIIHANDDFLKISGYTIDEVLGKSHNIIRHPDMPAHIFKNLWETIKDKRPWSGILKNRTKSGDFYWVQANIIPQFEKGKLISYLSVRYEPKKEEVTQSEFLYQKIKDKSAKFSLIESTYFLRFMNSISLSKKIFASFFLLFIPTAIISYQQISYQNYAVFLEVIALFSIAFFINKRVIDEYSLTLDKSVGTFYRLSEKRFGNSFDLKRNDMIGDFYRGLFSMDMSLSLDISENKRLYDESYRINVALDNVTSSVLVSDNNFNIVYLNRSAQTLISKAEEDFKNQIPNFDSKNILGKSMDNFHKKPTHQRIALQNLTGSITSNLIIANRHITVVANPVIDKNGDKLGFVSEWMDKTHEINVMREISDVVKATTNGNFELRIREQDQEGFILELIRGINQLIEISFVNLTEIACILNSLSHGDLTNTILNNYAGLFGQLQDDANATVKKLRDMIYQIQLSSETINIGAQEIASGNHNLSYRTEQQAASLEQTAASMQELTSTIQNNSDNAHYANQQAEGACEVAHQGKNVIHQVVRTMDDIAQSSKKIVDIITVIDGIAFQTNILALNAAVEAARAKEHGRGFAVVANEVRNLAQRAANAADEIKALIANSDEKIESGTKLVTTAGRTMEDIVIAIQDVSLIMKEISSASVEQAMGIEQINHAISQMDDVTQQNAAMVEEAAAAAEMLEEQAINLSTTITYFKL